MLFRGKNLFDELAHSNWVGLNSIVASLDNSKKDIGLSVEDLDKFLSYGQHVAVGYGDVGNMDDVARAAREVMRGIYGFVDGKSIKSLMVWISGPSDMCVVNLSKFNAHIQQSLNENCDYLWELQQYDDEKSIKVVVHAVWGDVAQEGIIPVFRKRNFLGDVTHGNWVALRELVDDLKIDDEDNVAFDLNDYKTILKFGQHIAVGVGHAQDGEHVEEAANQAIADIKCFLGERLVKDVAVHVSAGPELSMEQFTKLCNKISELASEDAHFICGLKQRSSNDNHVRLIVQVLW